MLRMIHEHEDPALMERIWRFRHTRFVEQLGWSELRRPDGRERDRFDNETAIHIVLLHDDTVVGYSRLLPTTGPHLATDIYRDASLEPPRGPEVFEWTRCATALNAPSVNGIPASDVLMTGVLECLLQLNVKEILFLTYPQLVRMMKKRGYPVRVLASFSVENNKAVQLAAAKLSFDLLQRHRQRYGIHQPLLPSDNLLDAGVQERFPTPA
ncbi:acyl-homoserine-lactone synthase [Rhizobium sp. 2YAF20]|uniref:acyl-homoserine-lactone synthase n=1 Tax=Rhizobium sp. 2YAF20 TaxID=3233027 RepID=UPI003F9E4AFA